MVPGTLHWQATLPLTVNSKIDRKALTALAGAVEVVEEVRDEPRTTNERRLAAAWAAVLGIPAHRIGRDDHFFNRGGTSLAAVKLAIALDRAVSLKDVTRNPVLADLARILDGRTRPRSGLLQPLSEPDAPSGALVCFPYAGGNAVSFEPLARALQPGGVAVYAVELPGHDLAGDPEPFASLEQVVEDVVREISERGLTRIMLWGHSSGCAFALQAARELATRDLDLRGVFLAAQLPGSAAERRAAEVELAGRTPAEILATLTAERGHPGLGTLEAQQAGLVASAYRHDCLSAHRYLAEALDDPPVPRLTVPVTAVLAADDPHTPACALQYRTWEQVAEHVDLALLDGGGHYFLRTQPVETARAVLRTAELLASP
jgi:surfactin synthase thioesterase subunit